MEGNLKRLSTGFYLLAICLIGGFGDRCGTSGHSAGGCGGTTGGGPSAQPFGRGKQERAVVDTHHSFLEIQEKVVEQ